MKGTIFNIQRYSLHDGTGIRTLIFFKGCPLHCPWCCNPESQSFEIEQGKLKSKCINCKVCSYFTDECPSGALTTFGKQVTVEELLKEIEKDILFYNTSNGGVTLSGGEVLAQADFATALLKEVKLLGINTAIETSGNGNTEKLEKLSDYLDLILFDLKIMDETLAKEILGADLNLIKKNFQLLVQKGKEVIPRVPLIPGYTISDENIDKIIDFVKSLNLKEIHILPFHQYGSNKYEYINKTYELKELKPPTEEEVNSIKEKMERQGLEVIIGGR
ncbi:MAG: [formate-C-acetyltransferase]-activating enzyme [Clostridiaceae bacterium]